MYYHVLIEQEHNGPELEIDLSSQQVIENIVNPYEYGENFAFVGKTIFIHQVNKVQVFSSEDCLEDKLISNNIEINSDESFSVIRSEILKCKNKTKDFITKPRGSKERPKSSRDSNFDNKKVFIVHGHDNELKNDVEDFLIELKLEPIILHKQIDEGNTLIEKLLSNSNVGYAFILLTPDDFGYSKSESSINEPRARQNVIFEFGYFIGKLDRKRVCCIKKSEVILPSDLNGLVYKSIKNGIDEIKEDLKKELKSVGIEVGEK